VECRLSNIYNTALELSNITTATDKIKSKQDAFPALPSRRAVFLTGLACAGRLRVGFVEMVMQPTALGFRRRSIYNIRIFLRQAS